MLGEYRKFAGAGPIPSPQGKLKNGRIGTLKAPR